MGIALCELKYKQTNNINIYREEHNIEHNMLVDGCDIEAIICRFRIII